MSRRLRMRGEEGTSLIIALLFVVATGLIIVALVNFTGTNLTTTAQLQNERALEYSAGSVMDGAIQMVRFDSASSTLSACTSATTQAGVVFEPPAMNGIPQLAGFCQWRVNPSNPPQNFRNVLFEVCGASYSTFADCQTNHVLEANIWFFDVNPNPPPQGTASPGFSMSISSWTVEKATLG